MSLAPNSATATTTQQQGAQLIKGTFSISGMQWKTLDPFLFCAFHKDNYPAGNGKLGPETNLLRGRPIGSDFSLKDGWSMYHGQRIPGFPEHPHRGFETITVTKKGWIDHFDSMGCHGRYGNGDTQWMTAGKGMQHCEMLPLLNTKEPNPTEWFQCWLNLPAKNKMVDPDYKMFWANKTSTLTLPMEETASASGTDERSSAATAVGKATKTGSTTGAAAVAGTVRVIAGSEEYFNATHPDVKVNAPPSNSWASQPGSDVAVWDITLLPGGSYTFPKAQLGSSVNRVLYFYEGDSVVLGKGKEDGSALRSRTAASVDAGQPFTLSNPKSVSSCSVLMLQGKPIGEPVAQHGPFVMNTQEEISEAFTDFRKTQFGGWPFDRSDPTNGTEAKKHATYPDGRQESPDEE